MHCKLAQQPILKLSMFRGGFVFACLLKVSFPHASWYDSNYMHRKLSWRPIWKVSWGSGGLAKSSWRGAVQHHLRHTFRCQEAAEASTPRFNYFPVSSSKRGLEKNSDQTKDRVLYIRLTWKWIGEPDYVLCCFVSLLVLRKCLLRGSGDNEGHSRNLKSSKSEVKKVCFSDVLTFPITFEKI